MSFTGPFEDRFAIRELMEHYADAVMQRDAASWSEVWAEDATWSLPEFEGLEWFEGKHAIVEGWKASMGDYPGLIYIATPGAINVDGDEATARTYTSEIFPGPDGGTLRVRGQYNDKLRKYHGRWLFTSRLYKTLRTDPS
ncbi:nuclear transport factor 2 family protein [Haliea sp. E17]|uniref:nuclear transport factor 2 family protein n=1 Tax=Haliea sp. E17 TaxID=3401576 RepID=UPI003AABBBAF